MQASTPLCSEVCAGNVSSLEEQHVVNNQVPMDQVLKFVCFTIKVTTEMIFIIAYKVCHQLFVLLTSMLTYSSFQVWEGKGKKKEKRRRGRKAGRKRERREGGREGEREREGGREGEKGREGERTSEETRKFYYAIS